MQVTDCSPDRWVSVMTFLRRWQGHLQVGWMRSCPRNKTKSDSQRKLRLQDFTSYLCVSCKLQLRIPSPEHTLFSVLLIFHVFPDFTNEDSASWRNLRDSEKLGQLVLCVTADWLAVNVCGILKGLSLGKRQCSLVCLIPKSRKNEVNVTEEL